MENGQVTKISFQPFTVLLLSPTSNSLSISVKCLLNAEMLLRKVLTSIGKEGGAKGYSGFPMSNFIGEVTDFGCCWAPSGALCGVGGTGVGEKEVVSLIPAREAFQSSRVFTCMLSVVVCMLFSSSPPSGNLLASFYIYNSTVNTISFTNLSTSSFCRSNSRSTFCLNAQNSFLSSVTTTAESLFSAERLDCCMPRERVGNLTREVFFSSPSADPFFSYTSSFFLLSSLTSLHLKESCVWFSGWMSVDECMRDREELKSLSTDWDRSREGANLEGRSLLGVRKAVSRWVGLPMSLHLQCLSLIDSYKLFQPITAPLTTSSFACSQSGRPATYVGSSIHLLLFSTFIDFSL